MSKFTELLEKYAKKRKSLIFDLKASPDKKIIDMMEITDTVIHYIMSQEIAKDFKDAATFDLKDFLKASEVMYHFRNKLGDNKAMEKYCKETTWAIKEIGKKIRG